LQLLLEGVKSTSSQAGKAAKKAKSLGIEGLNLVFIWNLAVHCYCIYAVI